MWFKVRNGNNHIKSPNVKGFAMAEVSVEDIQGPFGASVTFLDAAGNPTEPQDVPQWASDNETVATVVAADDGKSATVTLTKQLGAAIISCDSTDNDGTQVHAQGTVTVLSSEATSGEVTFDVPAPTPTEPEPTP